MKKLTAIGITLPIKRSQNGFFDQSYSIRDQSKSNLTNLVLTEKGERLMQPEFGCNLQKVLFESQNSDITEKIQQTIDDAVAIWLPYINLNNIQVVKDEDTNTIYVKIDYSLTNSPTVIDTITVSF